MDLENPTLFRQQCFIDGVWLDADNGEILDVDNPATGAIIGSVPRMGTAETRRAIEAARPPGRTGAQGQQRNVPRFCAAGST